MTLLSSVSFRFTGYRLIKLSNGCFMPSAECLYHWSELTKDIYQWLLVGRIIASAQTVGCDRPIKLNSSRHWINPRILPFIRLLGVLFSAVLTESVAQYSVFLCSSWMKRSLISCMGVIRLWYRIYIKAKNCIEIKICVCLTCEFCQIGWNCDVIRSTDNVYCSLL